MKPKGIIGLALLLSTLPFLIGGSVILYKAMDSQSIRVRQSDATAAQCTRKLNEIADNTKGTVQKVGTDTVLVLKEFGDPRMALSIGDIAIMMCPNLQVTDQCMGDRCKGSDNKVIYRMTFAERTQL